MCQCDIPIMSNITPRCPRCNILLINFTFYRLCPFGVCVYVCVYVYVCVFVCVCVYVRGIVIIPVCL